MLEGVSAINGYLPSCERAGTGTISSPASLSTTKWTKAKALAKVFTQEASTGSDWQGAEAKAVHSISFWAAKPGQRPVMAPDAAKAFEPKVLYPPHYGDTDGSKPVTSLKDTPAPRCASGR